MAAISKRKKRSENSIWRAYQQALSDGSSGGGENINENDNSTALYRNEKASKLT